MRTAYRVGAILLCTACLLAAIALQQRHVDYGEHLQLVKTLADGREIHHYARAYTTEKEPPEVGKGFAGKWFMYSHSFVIQAPDGSGKRLIGRFSTGYSLRHPEFATSAGIRVLDVDENGTILISRDRYVRVVKCDPRDVSRSKACEIRSFYSWEPARRGRIVDRDIYELKVGNKVERWQLVPKKNKSGQGTLAATGAADKEAKLLWSEDDSGAIRATIEDKQKQ